MSEQLVTLMPLILLIVIMYFLLIRPQKKREKAVNAMRNSIKVGDDVTTIGGILGKVVKTKDDVLTIQVGADKTKFEVMRWAISKVNSDEPAASSRKPKREEPEEEPEQEAPKKSLPKRMKRNGSADESPSAEIAETEAAEAAEESEIKE